MLFNPAPALPKLLTSLQMAKHGPTVQAYLQLGLKLPLTAHPTQMEC